MPIEVRTDLAGPLTVTLFSVNNPTPTVGQFEISPQLGGYLATRIKMAKAGDVVVVVTADGKHYSDRRRIQVTAAAAVERKRSGQPNGGNDMTGTNDKMRARMKDGAAEIKLLLQHPMETGNRTDPATG